MRMRKNSTILLTLGGGALAAILMFGSRPANAAGPKPGQPGRRPWTSPVWVPTGPGGDLAIRQEICRQAPRGSAVLSVPLAASVWAKIWPGVPWPVIPEDHESVQFAAGILVALVAEYLVDPELFCSAWWDPAGPEDSRPSRPPPPPPPRKPKDPPPLPPLPPLDPPPNPTPDGGPIDIIQYEDVYPNDGYMYQVLKDDILYGTAKTRSVAYRALLSAGFKAAKGRGMNDADASTFALALANNSAARGRYVSLIRCDLYNDFYYTTYGFDSKYTGPGPHGRALRLLPIHADNRSRLKLGQSPVRKIDIQSGSGQTGGKLEYLHLPKLDLERLADTDLGIDDRIVPGEWPDGTTGMLPHPDIQRVMSTAGLPKVTYGCAPFQVTP